MDNQNNGVVPPVGGEIASPAPNPDAQKPATEPAPAEKPAAASNPTASFAQSTVGTSGGAAPAQPQFGATNPTQPVVQNQYPSAAPAGKKGGAGKIIALVIILVVLIGLVIGGIIFWKSHESNERILADALKSVIARGASTTATTVKVESDGVDVQLKLDVSSNDEAESFVSIDLEANIEGLDTVKAKLEAIEGKDALYARVADYGSIASTIGTIAQANGSTEDLEYILSAAFNKVGTDWYEIPYSLLGSNFKSSMDCARGVSKDLSNGNYNDELIDSFKAHPFWTIEGKPEKKDGYRLYTVKTDEEEAQAFVDSLKDANLVKDVQKCVESVGGRSLNSTSEGLFEGLLGNGDNSVDRTITTLYDEEDDSLISGNPSSYNVQFDDLDFKLGITFWKHELVYASISGEQDGAKLSIETNISDDANFEIPSNAKSITDLQSVLEEVVSGVSNSQMEEYYNLYCTKEKNYSGYGDEAKCKEAVDELFGGGSGISGSGIESLIDGLSI